VASLLTNNATFGNAADLTRVAYLESHDVVGDLNGGVRLTTALDATTPTSYRARKLSTLGAALTFTAPGMPMLFQGQEMLENRPFSDTLPVDWSKTVTYTNIVRLYRNLVRLRRNLNGVTPGLKGDQCSVYQVDNANKLLAYRRWKTGAATQDTVVVANFANTTRSNYTLKFPRTGLWYVYFNSDSASYGADYGNVGPARVAASGTPATAGITIGPYSALILSQTPPPTLTVSQTNGLVTVSWPLHASGWVLDTSPTLPGNPPPWASVPAAQCQTNASSIFSTFTSSANAVYRLRQP